MLKISLLGWLLLLALSAALVGLLELLRLPAALLLGPMLAAIILALWGWRLQLPQPMFHSSQAVAGCLIAAAVTPAVVATFAQSWWLFLLIVLAIIALCAWLGWLLHQRRIFSDATAIFGLTPGAASAMVAMAGDFGADMRLVAFMQYYRVLMVVGTITVMANFWSIAPEENVAAPFLAYGDLQNFGKTLALIFCAGYLGKKLPLPSGALLLPMLAGALLQLGGIMVIELPQWFLALNFAFLGWYIGLRFTRQTLLHAWHALPVITLSMLCLIACCAGLALILVCALDIDFLSAYLATSPGGLDSIAIIAAACHNVDLMFIMTLQTMRLALVILISPYLARFIARRSCRQ